MKLFRACFAIMLALYAAKAHATTPVIWSSDTHKQHFLDVNNDGTDDLLLQSKAKDQPHLLVFGVQLNHTTQFYVESSQTLKKKLNGHRWLAGKTQLLTGYFNDDEFEDALIINVKQHFALLLKGKPQGFRKPMVLSAEQFALPEEGKFTFHTGDFDGDGQYDLLALATNNGAHRVYHSHPRGGFNLAQTIVNNTKWGLKKNERLYIDDFNQDGKDDIFALAKKAGQPHYLILANNKGKFRNTNAQQLSADFANADWFENSYSSVIINTAIGPELVRLYNENGGINHEGKYQSDERDPMRFKTCKNISYHLQNKTVSQRCKVKHDKKHNKKWKRKQRKAKHNKQQLPFSTDKKTVQTTAKSSIQSPQSLTLSASAQETPGAEADTANEIRNRLIPAALNTAPESSVGAYPAVQQTFTLSWSSISTATHYEIWVRHSKDEPENTYISTSQTSYNITETFPGGRLYYIKACNQYGCSGLSPYKSVLIYDKPFKVTEFKPDISVLSPGNSVNLMWRRPEGMIGTGGYYDITQIYSSDTSPQTSTVTRFKVQNGQQTHHSLVLSEPGQYRFQINACNKTSDYCSENSGVEALVATVPTPPSDNAYIRNLTYSPIKLSVGHEQHYRFDYINSDLCQSSNLKKDGQAITGYVTYIDNPEPGHGEYTWSAHRTEAVSWEFDVSCQNAHSSFTQHVSTIIHAATPPLLNPDQETARVGEQKTIRVLANDTDPDGHPLSITAFTQPAIGSINCVTDPTLETDVCIYTAPQQLSSNTSTSFTYTVSDGWTDPVTSTVTIEILSTEPDPQAIVGQWDSPVTGTQVAPGYAPVNVSVGDAQSFGFSYHSVRYCENSLGNRYVEDNNKLKSGNYVWTTTREKVAQWDFTVTCYNNSSQVSFQAKTQITSGPPAQINDDYFVVNELVNNELNVLLNDETPNLLSITEITQGQFGTATISDDGKSLHYKTNGQFTGKDQFIYTAVRNGDTSAPVNGIVYVDVMPYQRSHLMLEYLFDDASHLEKDTSGYNRHGSVTSVAFRDNGTEKYADFSPAQYSRITIPEAISTSPEGTLDFRFYNTSTNQSISPRIFHSPPHNGFAIQLNSSAYMGFGTYSGGWHTAYADTKLNANQWYRGTITWGPQGMHAYINGVHGSTSSNYTGRGVPLQGKEFLGYVPNTPQYDFRGYIDYFRAYNIQFSTEQIAAGISQQNLPTAEPQNGGAFITGTPSLNQTLASNYDTAGITAERIYYRWYRGGNPVYGADQSSYTTTEADVGNTLQLVISYRDSTGQLIQIQSLPYGPISLTAPDINGLPQANNDQIVLVNNTQSTTLNVLENDTLSSEEANAIVSFSQTTHGQLTLETDHFIYTPNTDYTGADSFTYTLSDGFEMSTATVELEILGDASVQQHRNLVLEYLFDDINNLAKDTSGNGRHGSVNSVAFRDNGTEKYADFSPAQYSRITIPEAISTSSEGTLDFRFYNTSTNQSISPRIFHSPPHNGFAIQLNSSAYMGFGTYSGGWHTAYADTKLNANQWYRGTITWGPQGMHAYINGVHGSTSSNYTGRGVPLQGKEFLGYVPNTPQYDFRGYIDYFRAYNKQFSDEEIRNGIKTVYTPEDNLTISGAPYPNQTLRALLEPESVTISSVNYRWLRNNEPVFGATSSSYTLTNQDTGQQIAVRAEYTGTDNKFYIEESSPVLINSQPPVTLTNLAITPTRVTIGGESTLTFDYSNALTCFNSLQPETLYLQSDSPQTGQYIQALPVQYQTGLQTVAVSCSNLSGQVSDEVSFEINKLDAPKNLTTN